MEQTDEGPTDQQREEWTAAFNELADVDGFITKNELEVHFQRCNKNPTKKDMDDVVEAIELADTDGDGKINLEEFMKLNEEAAKMSFYNADTKTDLEESLSVFDENGDGTISKEELRKILDGYEDSDLDEIINHADTNGDGQLSIKEVADFLTTVMS